MLDFYIYVIHVILCLWGGSLFIFWWRKTREATNIYLLITALLWAEAIRSLFFVLLTFNVKAFGNTNFFFNEIIMSNKIWMLSHYKHLWLVILPTTITYAILVVTMTKRIMTSLKIMRGLKSKHQAEGVGSRRKILIISPKSSIAKYMKGVFLSNGVDCFATDGFHEGLNIYLKDNSVSIVFIDSRAIENTDMKAWEISKILRGERPLSVISVITETPNIYQLFEYRRACFDDYIHMPIRQKVLMEFLDLYIKRIDRWKDLKYVERRTKKEGLITNRKNFQMREKSLSDVCEGINGNDKK